MTGPPTGDPLGSFTRYEAIRDEIANEINQGVYPAGALLPSIREIMQRWKVSTTTARRVLDELAAAGYARKEGTRGHISAGGPTPDQFGGPPTSYQPVRYTTTRQPPSPRQSHAAATGRLTVRPAHAIPVGGSIPPGTGTHIAALDVRQEPAPPDAALALRLLDPNAAVIVRRELLAATDDTPVQLRTGYLPAHLAENTPLAQPGPIAESWTAALTQHIGGTLTLAASHITARHPTHDEAPALALPPDAAVLVREDTHHNEHGTPIAYTRTVWPGDTTRLATA
jgi:DNA-binding GntR family transcriptional regulator